jgi:hypothetical protein
MAAAWSCIPPSPASLAPCQALDATSRPRCRRLPLSLPPPYLAHTPAAWSCILPSPASLAPCRVLDATSRPRCRTIPQEQVCCSATRPPAASSRLCPRRHSQVCTVCSSVFRSHIHAIPLCRSTYSFIYPPGPAMFFANISRRSITVAHLINDLQNFNVHSFLIPYRRGPLHLM